MSTSSDRNKLEYTLSIEKVLYGMDRVLTDIANRVSALERKVQSSASASAVDGAILKHAERISTMVVDLSSLAIR